MTINLHITRLVVEGDQGSFRAADIEAQLQSQLVAALKADGVPDHWQTNEARPQLTAKASGDGVAAQVGNALRGGWSE